MRVSSTTIVKILIVDDHPMVRDGISMRIRTQRDLVVCGEAASEEEAFVKVKETTPDLMIVDISLRVGNGIAVVKQVKVDYPSVKILVVSGFQESLYGERALRAGAMGYLNKQESNEKLLEAIRTVLAGNYFASHETLQRLVKQGLGNREEQRTPIEHLTNRELEVFRMIGEGLASSVIAEKLILSPHTIDTHREKIKRKLNIKSAGELTRTAVQWVLENE